MISQGQFARQHDGGGGSGESVVQNHLDPSNMEEMHVHRSGNRDSEDSNPLEDSSVKLRSLDTSDVVSKVADNAANESVVHDWNQHGDLLTTSDDDRHDRQENLSNLNTKTTSAAEVEMSSDNMLLDGNNRGNGGMRTRGNRRPILLTERMRQKRQTLQDMAKPLKAWLYEHRDNPYPSKNEKLVLAVGSQMTMVQVSNWFANARRRLKNTVRQPGLNWSKRIKLYNSHVTGNAERLSICSSISSISEVAFEDEQVPEDLPMPQLHCYETTSNYSSRPPSTMSQDAPHYVPVEYRPESPHHDEGAQHKFKHTILHRYLNDSYEHAQRYQGQRHHHHLQNAECPTRRRNGSGTGSVSSHDYEDVSLSRLSPQNEPSNETGPQGGGFFDELPSEDINGAIRKRLDSSVSSKEEEDTYWKEINAALVLTNMARACRQQQPIVTCLR